MNAAVKKENSRSLAEMLKVREDEAATLLDVVVAITFRPEDRVAADIAQHTKHLLERTVSRVILNISDERAAVEVVVCNAVPLGCSGKLWLRIESGKVIISKSRAGSDDSYIHPLTRLIAACYCCAAALSAVIASRLPYPVPDEYRIDMNEVMGPDVSLLGQVTDIAETHLCGAGAIGNGFVLGLSLLECVGKLYVVDDDTVSEGNLQRCALFRTEDIGQSKAVVLCAAASRTASKLAFIPRVSRLQGIREASNPAWLKRLVVAVDSPRARRSLQSEIPQEVFDASTTGAAEIVFHYHRQPNSGACLSCIYPFNADEDAHERHVAETLGVSLADVREIKVSADAASKIIAKRPHLQWDSVINVPYDTLFKASCSEEKVLTPEGRDALTPFAFVSTLAGALLALEFFRRVHRGHHGLPNFWRISPWNNPLNRIRRFQPKRTGCEFCAEPLMQGVVNEIWGEKRKVSAM